MGYKHCKGKSTVFAYTMITDSFKNLVQFEDFKMPIFAILTLYNSVIANQCYYNSFKILYSMFFKEYDTDKHKVFAIFMAEVAIQYIAQRLTEL